MSLQTAFCNLHYGVPWCVCLKKVSMHVCKTQHLQWVYKYLGTIDSQGAKAQNCFLLGQDSTKGLLLLWLDMVPCARPKEASSEISTEILCLAPVPAWSVGYFSTLSPGLFCHVQGSLESYKAFCQQNPSRFFKSPSW